jgi:hypothetical protein
MRADLLFFEENKIRFVCSHPLSFTERRTILFSCLVPLAVC